jgi:hypothetical protein
MKKNESWHLDNGGTFDSIVRSMKNNIRPALPFKLTDPDGLLFDEEPSVFVNLHVRPIVFTERGVNYFKPRFKYICIPLENVTSPEQFEKSYRLWLDVERSLLADDVAAKAAQEKSPGHYGILKALWEGDLDQAEAIGTQMDAAQKGPDLKLVETSAPHPVQHLERSPAQPPKKQLEVSTLTFTDQDRPEVRGVVQAAAVELTGFSEDGQKPRLIVCTIDGLNGPRHSDRLLMLTEIVFASDDPLGFFSDIHTPPTVVLRGSDGGYDFCSFVNGEAGPILTPVRGIGMGIEPRSSEALLSIYGEDALIALRGLRV